MSTVRRYSGAYLAVMNTDEPTFGCDYVIAAHHDAVVAALHANFDACTAERQRAEAWIAELEAQLAAVTQDCRTLCNALQRIEAGEKEPRMIARRTLEHWSEKSALAAEGDKP